MHLSSRLLTIAAVLTICAKGAPANWGARRPPVPPKRSMAARSDKSHDNIWSTGPLLHAVQTLRIFKDAKTFVDMPLKRPASEVQAAFEQQFGAAGAGVDPDALRRFLDDNFLQPGSDLPVINLSDQPPVPAALLSKLRTAAARQLVTHIHRLWFQLTRETSDSVKTHPAQHSLLEVPNPFIIPGDRFREAYYWDTFWSIEGMLVSGLTDIAKGIVDNLLQLARTYGHVPNGNRVYYVNRSQPPLLSEMVRAVHAATADDTWLAAALPVLVQEHAYWTTGPKALQLLDQDGQTHSLSRYWADWDAPRPESYRMDVEWAARVVEAAVRTFYRDMSSCAESGWDFSSRWCSEVAPAGGGATNLTTIRTTSIVPADLNAWLFQLESNVAAFARRLGEDPLAQRFARLAAARRAAMRAVMWSGETGQWHDVLLLDPVGEPGGAAGRWEQVRRTYASNWTPLWAGVAAGDADMGATAAAAFEASGLLQPGGVATSLVDSRQQWDLPNGWPNLQHMLVQGLWRHGGEAGQRLAREAATRWLRNCYAAYVRTGHFWEKYDVTQVGGEGGGGEYDVQKGFGWTNGVIMSLINMFGDAWLVDGDGDEPLIAS